MIDDSYILYNKTSVLEMTEDVLPLQSILCYTNRLYPFHVNVKLKKLIHFIVKVRIILIIQVIEKREICACSHTMM